ncbi:hypothetical protein [Bowmanella denitrificans]|uniref:hypothetical protein n=1 Tax=Bowmanella denitrificans TaxID=366582 RepID=UPI0011AF07D7|nr:hypothetical protein [Bowmanella denitrificans]
MKMLLIAGTLTLVLSACGGSSGDNKEADKPVNPPPVTEPTPDPARTFPDNTLWGESIRYFAEEQQGQNRITSVTQSAEGNLCYLTEQTLPENYYRFPPKWGSRVDCKNAQGEVYFSHQSTGNNILKQVLFTQQGQFVVAELIQATADGARFLQYYLQLTLHNSQGEVLQQKLVSHDASKHEQYLYVFDASPEYEAGPEGVYRFTLNNTAKQGNALLFDISTVKLQWHAQSLYMLSYIDGVSLYRFDANLEQRWVKQVAPNYSLLHSRLGFFNPAFTFSDDEILLAFESTDAEAKAYNWHFGRNLPLRGGDKQGYKNITLAAYDLQGEFLRDFRLLSEGRFEKLVDLTYQQGSLFIGANTHVKKFDKPNYTTEFDLVLMRTNPASGDILDYHVLDINQEDYATVFVPMPNQRFLFAGQNGYRQVDSNSQVSDGQGMALEVTANGEITRTMFLHQPRNVSIESVVVTEQMQLLFGGIYDGPISHTCDNGDMSMCYQKAMLGLGSLTPLAQ